MPPDDVLEYPLNHFSEKGSRAFFHTVSWFIESPWGLAGVGVRGLSPTRLRMSGVGLSPESGRTVTPGLLAVEGGFVGVAAGLGLGFA